MASSITITDPHTIELIEREASRLGLTETGYVAHLVEASAIQAEPPPRESLSQDQTDLRYERALAILREIHPHITDDDRAFDYDAWLYDEHGAPR